MSGLDNLLFLIRYISNSFFYIFIKILKILNYVKKFQKVNRVHYERQPALYGVDRIIKQLQSIEPNILYIKNI